MAIINKEEIIFKNKKVMNLRFGLLSVVILTISVFSSAQTARNPLNREPANVLIKMGNSSWKLSEEAFYRADGTEIDKRIFTYDESGRKISHTTLSWNEHDGLWQNSLKSDFVQEDNKSVSISSVGNMTGWQNSDKVESVYNAEGKRIYSLSYSWDNNNDDWAIDPSLKCEWNYDENGRVTEYLKVHPDKGTGEWTTFEARILYTYDKEGELTEELYQSWNVDGKSWESRGKYVYSKDSGTQKTATSYYYVYDKYFPDGKIAYLYDEEGRLARCNYYGNNPENSLSAFCLYTYTESKCQVISEMADISVYPNPVVSSFELTVPGALVGKTASIFDVYGNFVKSVVATYEKTQVNINGLSGGVYVLQIGDKTKKLVIR